MAESTMTNNSSTEKLEIIFKRLINGEKIPVYEINSIIENCHDVFVDPQYIDSLIETGSELLLSEDFWCSVVDAITADSLSEKAISFLYRHKIAVIRMCHQRLPKKWLIKYSEFDDEPLYILADRYIQESDKCFAEFVMKYVLNSEPIYRYLTKHVTYSSKWKTLVFLGMHSENCKIRTFAKDCSDIFQIGISVDAEQIRSAYEEHKRDPEWLLSIAANPNTPLDVLKDLNSISQIQQAKKIRMAAKQTIDLNLTIQKMHK